MRGGRDGRRTYRHTYIRGMCNMGLKINLSRQESREPSVSLSPGPRSKVGPGQDSWTSGDRLPGHCGPVLPAGGELRRVQFHRAEDVR